MKVPKTNARLVYITPGHQFPVGTTMSLARRLELLEWARRSGALVFEDDYDSEYRYSGRPVPALQGLDRHGLVLFAGTFSKVLFPSLRLGYLVVPPDLVPFVEAAKSLTSRHAPLLEQTVLCDFITEGHFGRHLRRMREIYAERYRYCSTARGNASTDCWRSRTSRRDCRRQSGCAKGSTVSRSPAPRPHATSKSLPSAGMHEERCRATDCNWDSPQSMCARSAAAYATSRPRWAETSVDLSVTSGEVKETSDDVNRDIQRR
ncbi:MAG TPA: PLP-dependent aminotransferase family protein [Thermoanaerobaculia bacterium]|nr:PLP-dependent aminotransferase family protein [Thermoanaerobaculia bacterium]